MKDTEGQASEHNVNQNHDERTQNTIVPPYTQRVHSNTPRGCLKPQMVTEPCVYLYYVFSYTYISVVEFNL